MFGRLIYYCSLQQQFFWILCLYVYQFLVNTNLDRSVLVHLKKEAIEGLELLPSFKIANIKREANMVTHIARFCFSCEYDGLLVEVVPSCMTLVIGNYFMNNN